MTNKLIILVLLNLLFSCTSDHSSRKKVISSSEKIIGFSVTSKNNNINKKKGKEVSLADMTTKNITSNNELRFKNVLFTLDNEKKEAINFYSKEGKLMCSAPINLSAMKMPPDAKGLTEYKSGENFEISGTTLIKFDSINFVISNIQYSYENK